MLLNIYLENACHPVQETLFPQTRKHLNLRKRQKLVNLLKVMKPTVLPQVILILKIMCHHLRSELKLNKIMDHLPLLYYSNAQIL